MYLNINNDKIHSGEIDILGAKNSALGIIAASVILDGDITLYNIPDLYDIHVMIEALKQIGFNVFFKNNTLKITGEANNFILSNESLSSIRGSYYFYSSLLAKFFHVSSFLPGGCNLGARPINYHLEGFASLGCDYVIFDNHIEIITQELHPNDIHLPFPSVGATINLIILASTILGVTHIYNPALEPEVLDLINFLNHAGAKISIKENYIEIMGVTKLKGIKYKIIPDRIESGSYMLLALTKTFSSISLNNTNYKHLEEVIKTIKNIGGIVRLNKNKITVISPKKITPINITSGVYPKFPTDLIQILAAILSDSYYPSTITDTIFENRYSYLKELKKLNIDVKYHFPSYQVSSSHIFNSAKLKCSDLRGAFSLFTSCFLTHGHFQIQNVDFIFRGYNSFLDNLKKLGVSFSLRCSTDNLLF